jgi:hypothetical protein
MANAGKQQPGKKNKKDDLPGYPLYPESEDIYSQAKEETEIDPENPKMLKTPPENPDAPNEKDFSDDVSGSDLDIPGADLDDAQEDIGSEDEENNHYSLGGDKD